MVYQLHRTEIPPVIWELNLSPVEFQLYCYYRHLSTDGGVARETEIAEKTGICVTDQIRSLKALCEPFEELGGKSLLILDKELAETGKVATTSIILVDIWEVAE